LIGKSRGEKVHRNDDNTTIAGMGEERRQNVYTWLSVKYDEGVRDLGQNRIKYHTGATLGRFRKNKLWITKKRGQ